jgi:hypothetical protein
MTRNKIAWLSAALTLLGAATASAQWDPESGDTGQGWQPPPAEQPQQPPPQQPPPQQPPPAQGGTWGAPPAEQPPAGGGWGSETERPPGMGGNEQPADTTPAGETDHDQVGAGLSFFGVNSINVSPSNFGGALSLTLPTVGARIWFGSVGLDVGLGLGTTTRKTYDSCPGGRGSDSCVDPASGASEIRTGGIDGGFGFGLHVGVPIAAAVSRHAALLIIPEVGFAYGQATVYNPAGPEFDVDLSGIQLDVGVRIGGELHFGAIGLPNLSLQLAVGLGFRYASRTAANSVPFGDPTLTDLTESDVSIRTIANDLMNGTIRVNYYF